MKIVMVGAEAAFGKDVSEKIQERLEAQGNDITIEWMKMLPAEKALEAEDLLITFNLSGFERQTLTGGISYNLLNCKQIHILLEDTLPCEEKLAMPLSISMFFFCKGSGYYEYLLNTYPEIPYLQVIDDWKEENGVAMLTDIIVQVSDICHLPLRFRKVYI